MERTRQNAAGEHERLVDGDKFSADELLLMDSQDLPYLSTFSAQERKVIFSRFFCIFVVDVAWFGGRAVMIYCLRSQRSYERTCARDSSEHV